MYTKKTYWKFFRHVTKPRQTNINFSMTSLTRSIFVRPPSRQFTEVKNVYAVHFAEPSIKWPTKTQFVKCVKLDSLENRCRAWKSGEKFVDMYGLSILFNFIVIFKLFCLEWKMTHLKQINAFCTLRPLLNIVSKLLHLCDLQHAEV